MHYAIVTETYPPEVNGVALTVQSMESGLRQRGHDVSVVRPRQSSGHIAECHETLVGGAQIPKYPGMRFGYPSPRVLRRHWTRWRPDAVYVATEGPLGWSAIRTANRMGIPLTTGFHTRFDQYARDYGLAILQPLALHWMRSFHNASRATLVPTCELAEFLRGAGFGDVVHLPRAVDNARFHPDRRDASLRRAWGVGDSGLAVIHVGRIAAEKNLPLAVRAFRAIQRQRPDARFVWVGEGPALAALQRDQPDFVFCGLQRGEEVARHFASADLFLFPSHSETFGNVTIEAMASGVPTVAFRYGAAREHLKDGLHGAAIAHRDEGAFVAAATRLALLTAAERQAMGRLARAAVRKLHPAQVAADLDDTLQRVILQTAMGGAHAQPAVA